jgi:stage II sporulation protein AB (anti-sigma F factor)
MQDVTGTFERSYRATPASVRRARADIADFAAASGVDPAHVGDIRLAVSEAVTNAVVHGYREMPGTVHVTAERADGALSISIRDFGCGMEPRSAGSGHTGMGAGLALIGRVVGDLAVAPQAGHGTEVRMRFDIAFPAARAARREWAIVA